MRVTVQTLKLIFQDSSSIQDQESKNNLKKQNEWSNQANNPLSWNTSPMVSEEAIIFFTITCLKMRKWLSKNGMTLLFF